MPTIKVGIPVSLTGQFQTQGRQALAGLKAWAEDVNEDGGLSLGNRSRPVSLIHYDDASLAEAASRATKTMIERDGVDLLFGPYSSGLASAAAVVAAEYGTVLWNQGGASEDIYQPERRVVGILNGARQYLSQLPGLLREAVPSAKTFGIVRCSVGSFPRQVSEGMEEQALAHGLTKVLHCEFPPDQADFGPLLAEIIQARPDLLLAVGRIRHDIAIAKALAGQWRDNPWPGAVAVVAAPIDRFRSELDSEVEGFIGPSQWEPPDIGGAEGLPDPYFGPTAAQVMTSLSRVASGVLAVDYPMVQAYAAGLVAQRCLLEAGTLDSAQLWDAAGKLDFHTFFGRFNIDPFNGRQIGRSPFIIQWQQGRKVVIWPPEHQQGKIALR